MRLPALVLVGNRPRSSLARTARARDPLRSRHSVPSSATRRGASHGRLGRPALRVAVPALALLLAGCAAPEPAAIEPASSEPEVIVDDARPVESFGEIVTGPAVGPDEGATTAAPPRLVAGEWWRIKYTGGFYGDDVEVVRVVADVFEDGYIFGMPHEGWLKEAIAYHAPAFGDVGLDLSYPVHNEVFAPVRFPLLTGATWETKFALADYVATVESADEHTATVVLTPPESDPGPVDLVMAALADGGDATMRLTYDARQHEVVRFESGFGTWEVVEHGYGYEGWVTVPRGEHTAIDYGRFGPVTPGALPTQAIEVSGGFNRMTLMHVVIPLAPGAYRITTTPPAGEPFVTEAVGPSGMALRFYEARDPDGSWATEDLIAGAGATYSMGIAYHQYDIRLPDGARRTDHSHEVVR